MILTFQSDSLITQKSLKEYAGHVPKAFQHCISIPDCLFTSVLLDFQANKLKMPGGRGYNFPRGIFS